MATDKSTTSRTAKKPAAARGSATTKKQSGAKKAPSSRTSAKASAAPKRASSEESGQSKRSSATDVARRAAAELADLTGKEVEGVTSFERTEHGWTVEVDVVELRRIPNTTDVLATYEVDLDSKGELEGYRRAHRYVRGVAGEE